MRKLRSRAAVPLLIETLIVQLENPRIRKDAANALTVLTGKPTPELWLADMDRIANLAKELQEWWEKERDTLATDFEKMTDAQIEGVVARLVQLDWELDRAGGGIADAGVFDEDLAGRMVPALLEHTKNRERRAAAGRLLGRLRVKTGGREIDAIAKDPKQDGGVRLGALLALKAAGEDLRAGPLLEILDAATEASRVEALDAAKEAALKEDAIAALADVCTKDRPEAQMKLLSLLDDADPAIRVAALRSLAKFAPAAETERLKKLLFNSGNLEEARAALRVLEVIQTPESIDALGDFLKFTLEPSSFHDVVRVHALSSFGFATGNRWIEAGPHPETYYLSQTKLAIEWWEASKKK